MRSLPTDEPIYLVSACSTGEELVAAFRRYVDRNGVVFVPIAEPLAPGAKGRFALTLKDGGVMVEGTAEVVSASRTPSVLYGRVGMTLKFIEPDEPSKQLLAELERARLSLKPPPPTVAPRPATIPASPRPTPPAPSGRVDAANALAECVAIGDVGSLSTRTKSTSTPPKIAHQKFVVPTIPNRPNSTSAPPPISDAPSAPVPPPPTPAKETVARETRRTVIGVPIVPIPPAAQTAPQPTRARVDPAAPTEPQDVPTYIGSSTMPAMAADDALAAIARASAPYEVAASELDATLADPSVETFDGEVRTFDPSADPGVAAVKAGLEAPTVPSGRTGRLAAYGASPRGPASPTPSRGSPELATTVASSAAPLPPASHEATASAPAAASRATGAVQPVLNPSGSARSKSSAPVPIAPSTAAIAPTAVPYEGAAEGVPPSMLAHASRARGDAPSESAPSAATPAPRRRGPLIAAGLGAAVVGALAVVVVGRASDRPATSPTSSPGVAPREPRDAKPPRATSDAGSRTVAVAEPADARPREVEAPAPADAAEAVAVPTRDAATEVAPGDAAPAATATECAVSISATPKAVDVFLAGKEIGTTPTKVTLPCGVETKLVFKKARYVTLTRGVKPNADKPKPLKVALARPTMSVKISSTPTGATVTLSGRVIGVTPTTVKLPGWETSTLSVFKDGYARKSVTVTPKANNEKVSATLDKAAKSNKRRGR